MSQPEKRTCFERRWICRQQPPVRVFIGLLDQLDRSINCNSPEMILDKLLRHNGKEALWFAIKSVIEKGSLCCLNFMQAAQPSQSRTLTAGQSWQWNPASILFRKMQVETLKSQRHKIIRDEKNHSLTKKYLSEGLVAKYEEVRTPLGGSLAQCVNTSKCCS